MSNKSKRRSYDQEFKLEAVRLILEAGRPLAQVSRELGVSENQLRRWKQKFIADGSDAFPGKGHLKAEDEELRRLRKELADVKEERDILKKAIGIFTPRKR